MSADLVNHPSHYAGQGKIECKELLKVICTVYEGYVAACVANIVKYCWRCHSKEPVRSLKSARWYFDEAVNEIKKTPIYKQARLFSESLYTVDEDKLPGSYRVKLLNDVYIQMQEHFGEEEFGFFKTIVNGLFDGGLYCDESLSAYKDDCRFDAFGTVGKALDDWISYAEEHVNDFYEL